MADESPSISKFVLPANQAVSLRIVVFAISLALLGFVTMGFRWFSETVFTLNAGGTIIYLLCGVALLGAILNGYVNDDLLVSCCVAGAPLVGFSLFPITVWLLTNMSGLSSGGETALVAGGVTAVVGSVGGLVGVLAGRRHSGRSSPRLD